MGLTARTPCWVREVCMAIDGVDCVVARSLTPLTASHGVWQGMRKLRTRPLADMLYNDPGIHRSAFVCSALTGAKVSPCWSQNASCPRFGLVWKKARRAITKTAAACLPTTHFVTMPSCADYATQLLYMFTRRKNDAGSKWSVAGTLPPRNFS